MVKLIDINIHKHDHLIQAYFNLFPIIKSDGTVLPACYRWCIPDFFQVSRVFFSFFWVGIWVLKIRRLLGYPKNHLKSMKNRWSINVFACFPMFSQAAQHFFHGRWKKPAMTKVSKSEEILGRWCSPSKKNWVKTAVFIRRTGLSMCLFDLFFFEIALTEMRFWRKSHRSKVLILSCVFRMFSQQHLGCTCFQRKKLEQIMAKVWPGQTRDGRNMSQRAGSLGASSPLFQ